MHSYCKGLLLGTKFKLTSDELEGIRKEFSFTKDLIFIIEPETFEILYANKTAFDKLGFTEEELIGAKAEDIEAKLQDEENWDVRADSLNENGSLIFTNNCRHKDGTTHPVEVSVTKITFDSKHYYLANARDITKRLEEEQEFREQHNQLRLLISNINAIGWELELENFNFTYVSSTIKKILGFPPTILKNIEDWKNLIHPDEREWAMNYCATETADGRDHDFEYRMKKSDGTYMWARDVVTVVKDENNKPIKLQGFIIDNSEKHQSREKLEAANRALQELNENLEERVENAMNEFKNQQAILMQQSKMAAAGEMIGAIAHQWKQPLNALGILIQDLEDAFNFGELDSAYIKKGKKRALSQIKFMAKTIDNFRNFFMPTDKKECIEISEAVEEVMDILGVYFERYCISQEFNIGKDLQIYGNKNDLKQIFLVIINNSIDVFKENNRDDGKIKIEIKEDEGNLTLLIEDNAGGIAKDLLPKKLFQPYVSTKGEKGTGIGLNIVKIIVEDRYCGEIKAENSDSGAVFIIKLPKKECEK